MSAAAIIGDAFNGSTVTEPSYDDIMPDHSPASGAGEILPLKASPLARIEKSTE